MKKSFSFLTRKENLKKIQEEHFDLLIIGGGINGAGVARDASSRGMKVALVEAHDFASGTSSRSSKLIHGGIRYLENKEFKLVFEALSEREKLFSIAPHLVHPMRFMIPIYKNSRVGFALMGLGMWLYDILSLFRAPQMHEKLNPDQTLDRNPILNDKDLCGSYVYSDAYMDDDRLTIETLRSAHEYGAVCVSYVRATGAEFKDGKIHKIKCTDQFTKKDFFISAAHVVSTVGPWTDELGQNLFQDWKRLLRPTKGVHLTFHKNRLPVVEGIVMGAESRIVFMIPRHEMIIVGTTDTDYAGKPEDVSCTAEDVKYLLGVVKEFFPYAYITEKDIVASYAGVRPLVHDSSDTAGKTSREHSIIDDPRGLTIVAGGKYTTYRLIAEEVTEKILNQFSIEDQVKFAKSSTQLPLNPMVTQDSLISAQYLVEEIVQNTNLSREEVELLVSRYGMEVEKLIRIDSTYQTLWEREAYFAIHNTMCMNLVDFYFRRTHLFLARTGHGLEFVNEVAKVFSEEFSWTPEILAREKQTLLDIISRELDWQG